MKTKPKTKMYHENLINLLQIPQTRRINYRNINTSSPVPQF